MLDDSMNFTLGICLQILYTQTKNHFRNQSLFFADLFFSYHQSKSNSSNIDFLTSQPKISQILHSKSPVPPELFSFYVGVRGNEYLAKDIELFLCKYINTNRQKKHLEDALHASLDNSTNLDPDDKKYIQEGTGIDTDNLNDMIFRALFVLLREPVYKPF